MDISRKIWYQDRKDTCKGGYREPLGLTPCPSAPPPQQKTQGTLSHKFLRCFKRLKFGGLFEPKFESQKGTYRHRVPFSGTSSGSQVFGTKFSRPKGPFVVFWVPNNAWGLNRRKWEHFWTFSAKSSKEQIQMFFGLYLEVSNIWSNLPRYDIGVAFRSSGYCIFTMISFWAFASKCVNKCLVRKRQFLWVVSCVRNLWQMWYMWGRAGDWSQTLKNWQENVVLKATFFVFYDFFWISRTKYVWRLLFWCLDLQTGQGKTGR